VNGFVATAATEIGSAVSSSESSSFVSGISTTFANWPRGGVLVATSELSVIFWTFAPGSGEADGPKKSYIVRFLPETPLEDGMSQDVLKLELMVNVDDRSAQCSLGNSLTSPE
jgi:hypothetical protein